MTRKSRREIENVLDTVEGAIEPSTEGRLAGMPPEKLVLVMLEQRAMLIDDPDDEAALLVRERAATEYRKRLEEATGA